MKKPKAIGYWRVSKEDKKRNQISPTAQQEKIKYFCKSQDWQLVKMFGDFNYSGSTLNRPGLKELLKYIQEHQIDAVVVYKVDRLSRKQRDFLNLIEDEFKKYNVGFKSVSEPFETTSAYGRAGMSMVITFAQLERDLISQRTQDALATLKRKGRWLGCPKHVPFGFSLKKTKQATFKDLKPNGEFNTLKNILSSRKTITELAAETGLAKSSIWYIKRNPVYDKII